MMELVGIILPPLIDLVNKHISDRTYRFLIAFLVCAVIGLVIVYVEQGQIMLSGAVNSILAVFGASQLSYSPIYKDSRVQKLIKK